MKWFARKKRKANRRVTATEAAPRRWPRLLAVAAAVLLTAVAGAYAANYLRAIEWERFHVLEVSGELDRVAAEEIHAVLEPHITAGFAGIDMRAARETLEAMPWIADAAVRRAWPGTLVVEVREERPVATWFGTALMNADGEVFVDGAAGLSGVLPDVGGPAGAQREMVRRLNDMRHAAATRGLELRRLLRTERRAERFWLANGVEVRLGRRDVDARMQRFLAVAWPALEARSAEVAYVDMRYTNGFAVGWKAAQRNGENRRERS